MSAWARLRLLVACVVTLAAGCAALGPDYRAPDAGELGIPAAWHGVEPAHASSPADLVTWWRTLGDATLDELIAAALAANPDMKVAQARLREARARRDIAGAGRFPTIGASASASRTRTEAGAGSSRAAYDAGFDASWEPDIFGGQRRAIEAATARTSKPPRKTCAPRKSRSRRKSALNYVQVRALQARLGIARANLGTQSETLQLTQWRAQAGLTSSLDVEQARAAVEQTRAQVPVARKLAGRGPQPPRHPRRSPSRIARRASRRRGRDSRGARLDRHRHSRGHAAAEARPARRGTPARRGDRAHRPAGSAALPVALRRRIHRASNRSRSAASLEREAIVGRLVARLGRDPLRRRPAAQPGGGPVGGARAGAPQLRGGGAHGAGRRGERAGPARQRARAARGARQRRGRRAQRGPLRASIATPRASPTSRRCSTRSARCSRHRTASRARRPSRLPRSSGSTRRWAAAGIRPPPRREPRKGSSDERHREGQTRAHPRGARRRRGRAPQQALRGHRHRARCSRQPPAVTTPGAPARRARRCNTAPKPRPAATSSCSSPPPAACSPPTRWTSAASSPASSRRCWWTTTTS